MKIGKKYILDDGSKSAVVWVDKIEPVAANSLRGKVHFLSFSDKTVKEILNHLYAKMHASQHTSSKSKYQLHTDFTVVLTGNTFDKYFKKVPKIVSGARRGPHVSASQPGGYSYKVSAVNANGNVATGPIKATPAVDFIINPVTGVSVTLSKTCDCGGVKCGHPDEAGPGHARWCKLMQGDLPG